MLRASGMSFMLSLGLCTAGTTLLVMSGLTPSFSDELNATRARDWTPFSHCTSFVDAKRWSARI